MSQMTTIQQHRELADFAEMAAKAFASNEQMATFSKGLPTAGDLLALRWGLGNDCVLVVRLDENFEPVNFQQATQYVTR